MTLDLRQIMRRAHQRDVERGAAAFAAEARRRGMTRRELWLSEGPVDNILITRGGVIARNGNTPFPIKYARVKTVDERPRARPLVYTDAGTKNVPVSVWECRSDGKIVEQVRFGTGAETDPPDGWGYIVPRGAGDPLWVRMDHLAVIRAIRAIEEMHGPQPVRCNLTGWVFKSLSDFEWDIHKIPPARQQVSVYWADRISAEQHYDEKHRQWVAGGCTGPRP